jgi:Glycosyl hydrolases family 2, TIM barrel domain
LALAPVFAAKGAIRVRLTTVFVTLVCGGLAACDGGAPAPASVASGRQPALAQTVPDRRQSPDSEAAPIVLMWQVQQSGPHGDFALLRNLGVNAVQASKLATWPAAEIQAYLDGASSERLKVFVYLGIFREGDGPDCRYSDAGIRFIRTYQSHPAVHAWHSLDEPAGHGISRECQRALYDAIKALDPTRPVMVSSNTDDSDDYERYFDERAFDILEMHKYVNPRPSAAQERLLDLFRAHRSRDYPVIITLRAFNSPHKLARMPMTEGSLTEQYAFFFAEPPLTRNLGFYGWDLSPNKGLKNDPDLRRDFDALMARLARAQR